MATISQAELDSLMDSRDKLTALENAGVDNWEGYDIALDDYNAKKQVQDKADASFDEAIEILSQGVYEPSEHGAGIAFTDEVLENARNVIRKLVA